MEFTQGFFDGQAFSPAQLKQLEDLPSKIELITKIAQLVQQVRGVQRRGKLRIVTGWATENGP